MFVSLLPLLTLIAAVACALVAGIFLAFSSFVMAALGRLPSEQGIAAMQAINITVLNPLFLGLFFGAGLLCLVLAGGSILHGPAAGGLWLIAATIFYVAGSLLVTMIFNVPLNEALAKTVPASSEGAELWHRYIADWTMWNHVRTLCSALAAILMVLTLL